MNIPGILFVVLLTLKLTVLHDTLSWWWVAAPILWIVFWYAVVIGFYAWLKS